MIIKKFSKIYFLFFAFLFVFAICFAKNVIYKNITIFNVNYRTPANTGFVDDNFYKCVIDAYNEKNNTSLPYSTNLSAEMLNTITNLICTNNEIVNTTGLEMLTNLKELKILQAYDLSNININSNLLLEKLSLSELDLTELDLSKNVLLTDLYIDSIDLLNLNLNNNTKLESIIIQNDPSSTNFLPVLNLDSNISLKSLKLLGVSIEDLNLQKNLELIELRINDRELTNLNISTCIKLGTLDLHNTSKLTNLDLSKNVSLSELIIYNTSLSSLNTDTNILLKKLWIFAPLHDIDITKNILLEELRIDQAPLSILNLSKNINLKSIIIASTYLDYLDISKCPNLEEIYIPIGVIQTLNNSAISAFNTNGGKIYDNNFNELGDGAKIKTGNFIKYENAIKPTYISILGDTTGDGEITIADVARLYQYIKGKISMNDCYKHAGDVVDVGDIKISDVAKLYQYVKGKIGSLK